jgi:sterol desaturase/sphingolipid hydroxylase (fatty acid hydroxylase superfamily)
MLIGLPMVIAFGLSPWVLLLYELLDVTVTLFSHSNLRIPRWLNRYLRYVIVTPDLHKVHHSTYQPETDSNFSAVLPIWDILFGTFRTQTRKPLATMPLGLEGVRGPQANEFWWLLKSPFLSDKNATTSIEAHS